MEPYLTGEARAAFDRWLEAAVARCTAELSAAELRKGVRALSSLWVERRGEGALAERALEGRAKRAAFATYYTALHFLTAWHALDELGPSFLHGLQRIHDLGCGAGAAGAAAGLAAGGAEIHALDRSGFALGEARRTYAAFGLRARTRRGSLPEALPARVGARDLIVLGWAVNELTPAARGALLDALAAAVRRDARFLVLEPLAGAVSPWWPAWVERLAPLGAESRLVKRAVALPDWIADLDRAAGLDHAVLGARVLARTAASGSPGLPPPAAAAPSGRRVPVPSRRL